jgi:hypothetical protein
MSARAARAIAWTLCAAGIAAIVAASVLAALYPFTSAQEVHDPVGEFIWSLSWVGFSIVGALIVTRRPDNRIGWVLIGITCSLAAAILGPVYGRAAYSNPTAQLPLGPVGTWIGTWMFSVAAGLVVTLLLLFPTGRLQGPRQRFIGAVLAVAVVSNVVFSAFRPGPVEGDTPPLNPLGIEAWAAQMDAAAAAVGAMLAVTFVLAVLDFIHRFWRSEGVRRQQFRWMAYAAGAFPVLFVLAVTLEDTFLSANSLDPVVFIFFLCGNGLAAAIGVAVTRHGLYEINRIVSRTVTYALLTALLAAVYVGGVTLLTARTAGSTENSPVAVAAATLAAAAAFGPARRRIQGVVDRRFNRSRYDASITIESYRARLRDEVDLSMLITELTKTVAASMQPSTAVLWLAQGSGPAEKVSPDPSPVTVPERNRETRGLL